MHRRLWFCQNANEMITLFPSGRPASAAELADDAAELAAAAASVAPAAAAVVDIVIVMRAMADATALAAAAAVLLTEELAEAAAEAAAAALAATAAPVVKLRAADLLGSSCLICKAAGLHTCKRGPAQCKWCWEI